MSVGLGRGAEEKEKRWCCVYASLVEEKKDGGVGEEREENLGNCYNDEKRREQYVFCFVL